MKCNQLGLDIIKEYESFSPVPYICPAGKNTIGYGHVILSGERFDRPITKEFATEILAGDVKKAEEAIYKFCGTVLQTNQFSALVSLVFNIGASAFKDSTLLAYLNEGKADMAAREFDRWVFCKGKKLAGLVARRNAEQALFEKD